VNSTFIPDGNEVISRITSGIDGWMGRLLINDVEITSIYGQESPADALEGLSKMLKDAEKMHDIVKEMAL